MTYLFVNVCYIMSITSGFFYESLQATCCVGEAKFVSRAMDDMRFRPLSGDRKEYDVTKY